MSWWRKILGGLEPTASAAGHEARTPPASSAEGPQDALVAALARVYGDQQPFHFGVGVAFADGGPDPLDGVSIFWNERGPHWHYVSFGMGEVMGAELTFRIAAKPSDIGTEPAKFLGSFAYQAPTWPIALLNLLARRVRRTKRPFAHGHWWEGAPGVLEPHTKLRHLAFARDPELGAVRVDNREIVFLQGVGVSAQTIEAMKVDEREKRGVATLEALATADPLLVTHLARFE